MDDDNERHRQLLFDTSILVPIAIAGGITFIIILFVYCCRRYQSFLGSNRSNQFGRSYESSSEISQVHRRNNRHRNSQQQSRNGTTDYVHTYCLPWSRAQGNYTRRSNMDPSQHQFYTAALPQANYHSTQSTAGLQHLGFPQGGDTGAAASPTVPSAPSNYETAPPSYTTAMLYATVIKNNGYEGGAVKSGQRAGQDFLSSEDKLNIPPPPYSRNT